MRNSTIQPKIGICSDCPPGSKPVPLIKGKCGTHYWGQINQKSVERRQAKAMGELEPVKILTDDLDILFSQQVRLTYADEYGMVACFTCGVVKHWKKMDCGHFISRAKMPTRYSLKNCKPQCGDCNRHNDGEEKVFAEKLEAEEPGLVEILKEQSRDVQDFTRDDLKALIADTTRKVKALKAKVIYQ